MTNPPICNPCIICVAITGSVPRKEHNPAVPITIAEQIESTQAAFEAGASIAHCHVRLEDGTLNHTVVTYLIGPDGNIRRHYLGLEHAQEEVMVDLLEVLS